VKKLDIEQAEQLRKKFASDWEIRKGLYLYKKVALDDYNQVLRFLMAVEKPQIKLDHFADFMNFYNELTIGITTHDVNGLTELDFQLALYIDKALEQMGARQLDEKWSAKYKRSINCSNPKGFSQKAHCAGRKKKESIKEGFKLKLERDTDVDVLHIVNTDTGGRTEVRGKKGYESGNYDPNDKLHQLLDRVGKSANISELINGEVVSINPKHPDGEKAKAATDVAYNESTDLDSLRKFVRSQREAPDQVLYQMMMAPDTYGHAASNFVRSWYERTKEENGLNDVDSALEIMVDQLGLNENFADGKVKGKSRPGRVKRSGASCNGSVTSLRKRAKNSSGEKARMYHWCANMKGGKKK
jgi:4a-hydroxytetrahydrobiopterin dehydratase